jgi:sugar O-acyltransferase (sialic acid O-acetyltransferase NeuD family)
MRPLVILGTGGGVHDLLDIVDAVNAVTPTWKIVGFLDDAKPRNSRQFGYEVLGPLGDAPRLGECSFINAIGSDSSFRNRPRVLAATGLPRAKFATLVHPGASVSPRARLGSGVSVASGVSIGGGVSIGDQVTICPGAIVGHDALIKDFTMLAPGAVVSGLVHVGRACYLGAGSVIRQQLGVGDGALIGMGAVVVKDVGNNETVIGVPARCVARWTSLPRVPDD